MENKIIVLVGSGNNGKTTLTKMIKGKNEKIKIYEDLNEENELEIKKDFENNDIELVIINVNDVKSITAGIKRRALIFNLDKII